MKKILLIGPSGAGKTVFLTVLAAKLTGNFHRRQGWRWQLPPDAGRQLRQLLQQLETGEWPPAAARRPEGGWQFHGFRTDWSGALTYDFELLELPGTIFQPEEPAEPLHRHLAAADGMLLLVDSSALFDGTAEACLHTAAEWLQACRQRRKDFRAAVLITQAEWLEAVPECRPAALLARQCPELAGLPVIPVRAIGRLALAADGRVLPAADFRPGHSRAVLNGAFAVLGPPERNLRRFYRLLAAGLLLALLLAAAILHISLSHAAPAETPAPVSELRTIPCPRCTTAGLPCPADRRLRFYHTYCYLCGNTGIKPVHPGWSVCHYCQGAWWVGFNCPYCHEGFLRCPRCRGRGVVEVSDDQ